MYQIANANGVTLADGDTIDIELEEETYRRWVEGWVSSNQTLSLLIQVYRGRLDHGRDRGRNRQDSHPIQLPHYNRAPRAVRLSSGSGSSATVSYG